MEGKSTMSAIIRIPLPSRKYPGLAVLVDEADAEWVQRFAWFVIPDHRTFYALRCVWFGRHVRPHQIQFRMHRELMAVPDGMVVDHIDGNGLNNSRSNLRVCTVTENVRNRQLSLTNTSGYIGVAFFPRTGRWKATIGSVHGNRHLGYFSTALEAALAYDAACRELRGEFAHLNFP